MADEEQVLVDSYMAYVNGKISEVTSEEAEFGRVMSLHRDRLLGWLRSVKAEVWDEAVASLVYDDGTPLEVVKNINPYREAND